MPSLLRGFSAPVILERQPTPAERAFLLAHDRDPFNKWEAGRAYALALARPARGRPGGGRSTPTTSTPSPRSPTIPALDPAFKALALGLPSEDESHRRTSPPPGGVPDPLAVHRRAGARSRRRSPARSATGSSGSTPRTPCPAPTAPTPAPPAAGRCAARALALLTALDPEAALARAQFAAADNMTERMARARRSSSRTASAEAALADFHAAWRHDRLVDRQVVRGAGGADPARGARSPPSRR